MPSGSGHNAGEIAKKLYRADALVNEIIPALQEEAMETGKFDKLKGAVDELNRINDEIERSFGLPPSAKWGRFSSLGKTAQQEDGASPAELMKRARSLGNFGSSRLDSFPSEHDAVMPSVVAQEPAREVSGYAGGEVVEGEAPAATSDKTSDVSAFELAVDKLIEKYKAEAPEGFTINRLLTAILLGAPRAYMNYLKEVDAHRARLEELELARAKASSEREAQKEKMALKERELEEGRKKALLEAEKTYLDVAKEVESEKRNWVVSLIESQNIDATREERLFALSFLQRGGDIIKHHTDRLLAAKTKDEADKIKAEQEKALHNELNNLMSIAKLRTDRGGETLRSRSAVALAWIALESMLNHQDRLAKAGHLVRFAAGGSQ